ALEIQLLHLVGRGLENDLELVVLVEAIRVLAETAVGWTARRLYVCHAPMAGPEDPQERFREQRPGAQLDVVRLLRSETAGRPEFRQLEDKVLKRHAI